MNDSELWEILNSYKTAIDALIEKADALSGRIDDVEKMVVEEILEPAKQMFADEEKEERFRAFHDRNGATLDPYNERLRAIEGEDFDLSRQAFDSYNELPEEGRMDEGEYVKSMVDSVEKQLEAIRTALGADKVEAETNADGETEIKADGEEVEAAEESTTAEETADVPEVGAGDVQTNPEELAAFEKELEAYKG